MDAPAINGRSTGLETERELTDENTYRTNLLFGRMDYRYSLDLCSNCLHSTSKLWEDKDYHYPHLYHSLRPQGDVLTNRENYSPGLMIILVGLQPDMEYDNRL